MAGRKRVELIVTFECDEQDDPKEFVGGVELVVEEMCPSAWSVNCDVNNEEEL